MKAVFLRLPSAHAVLKATNESGAITLLTASDIPHTVKRYASSHYALLLRHTLIRVLLFSYFPPSLMLLCPTSPGTLSSYYVICEEKKEQCSSKPNSTDKCFILLKSEASYPLL
jgi:hypothetical protein